MAKTRAKWTGTLKLRDKLFMSFSLLSIGILLAAAWVINSQVVAQVRLEVQKELKASLPLYDAVWEEQAGRLSSMGMAMAGSPIVKTIFRDPRASRDRETVRQMLADFGQELSENVDLILISDGGGTITFSESRDPTLTELNEFSAARNVASEQKPAMSFALLNGRLFHLALTPVVLHSGSAVTNNTLAVLITGSELNRRMAEELRRRAHSDVLFFAGDRLHSSSLAPEAEASAGSIVVARGIGRDSPDQPTELMIGGESQLAFARQLTGFDGRRVGYVVVLHSLEGASRLFRAISNRLILVGTIGIVLVLVVSYLIARRVTRPIESLVIGARELGRGNYEHRIDPSPEGEVGQLAAAFEQMRQSIKRGQAELLKSERLATVGQMAGSIIHDLRGPLASIVTAADLFSRSELSPEQRQVLSQSQLRASTRMGAMLREILEFARGDYSLNLARRDLAGLLDSVVRECITSDAAPGVAVEASISPHLFVRVDEERMRRLFENLFINSIHAMPQGGKITLHAAESGQRVRITVADTGCGIPTELRDRLFEPFVSRGKQGGTGLGLAIASSIARAHGGSLTLISAQGQPADFCVELPLDSEVAHGR
jgi:signal transduction histidine kinase